MYINLKFDYYMTTLYVPDGYILDIKLLQDDFLEWVSNNPECIILSKGGNVLSYSDKDFLQYVNEELLKESKEKAYIEVKPVKKKIRTLVF